MIDVQIVENRIVRMQKKLWHATELTLAKCFNFNVNMDTGVIEALIHVTTKKAMFEFIRLSFKNFSESPVELDRRNAFYYLLEEIYKVNISVSEDFIKTKIPYFEKFYQHQKDTLNECFYKQYNFLALDMGLGKTICSASISRVHQVPRTLIICPASVKWNWYRDLTGWGFNELYFTILDSTKSRTMRALNERFVVINYDILGSFTKEICQAPIGHFILDEAHMLKNHTSQRYKNAMKIIEQFPEAKITFLSGTPIKNRVNDVYGYLKLINHELGHNHKKFLDEYTIKASSRGGDRVTGGRNLQDLHLKLSNFMIRKTKEECLDLPGKIFLSYRFELDDYREEYDKVIEELSKNKDISSLTGNLHSLNIITSKAKIPGIKELADNIIESGKKVVIFGGYRDPINELEAYFGNRCVKIDGSVNSWERDQRVQRFWNDEECVVFLGNMIAAGVGINLTNASDVIFMNFSFSPADMAQAMDRCDRIGQTSCVNVHYTFCDESIDEYIYEIIIDKEKDVNAVIDTGKEVVLRENITEILIKKLLNRNVDTKDIVSEPIFENSSKEVQEGAGARNVQEEVSNSLPEFTAPSVAGLPQFPVETLNGEDLRESDERKVQPESNGKEGLQNAGVQQSGGPENALPVGGSNLPSFL